jgi:hypothetical protein
MSLNSALHKLIDKLDMNSYDKAELHEEADADESAETVPENKE